MTKSPNITGELAVFGSEFVHAALNLDGQTVRQWRNRGFFSDGEKAGRHYLYNIADITKLVILREFGDAGVSMSTAAVAADMGTMDAVAHALSRAPLVEVWATSADEAKTAMSAAQADVPWLFSALETDFLAPYNYLITGGDEIDDWTLVDSLDEVAKLENYNLVKIHADLRIVADRVIAALEHLDDRSDDQSDDKTTPLPAVCFETETLVIDKHNGNTDPHVERIVLAA